MAADGQVKVNESVLQMRQTFNPIWRVGSVVSPPIVMLRRSDSLASSWQIALENL